MRLSRPFLWNLLAVPVITGLGVAGVALRSDSESYTVICCGFVAMLYAGQGLACAAAREQGRAPRLMLSGIVVGAFSLVAWLVPERGGRQRRSRKERCVRMTTNQPKLGRQRRSFGEYRLRLIS